MGSDKGFRGAILSGRASSDAAFSAISGTLRAAFGRRGKGAYPLVRGHDRISGPTGWRGTCLRLN